MKKSLYLFTMILLILLLGSQTAFAGKHGVFLDLSSGSGDAEWDSDIYSWDVDSDSFAIGYIFDSNPEPNRVFNYRLNVGVIRQDLEDDYGDTIESTGIYAENIFGFALIRNEHFRWWAGPLVRLGVYSGEASGEESGVDYHYSYKLDAKYVEFGLGLVTGMNFTVGRTIISPSLGVRFSGYAVAGEISEKESYEGIYGGGYEWTDEWSEDMEATTTSFFFNLAILF